MEREFQIAYSGTADYSDMQKAYKVIDIAKFLNTLEPEVMESHRDSIILTLLYYTTDDKYGIQNILKGYLEDLK